MFPFLESALGEVLTCCCWCVHKEKGVVLNPKIALDNIIAYKQRQAGYSHGQKRLALSSISATGTSHTR
jgi:hypothetical protein